MILQINGNLIDTEKIYQIGKIEPDAENPKLNGWVGFFFVIYFLEGKELKVGIEGEKGQPVYVAEARYSFIPPSSRQDDWIEGVYSKTDDFKERIARLNEAREKLKACWAVSQTKYPSIKV